MSPTIRRLMKEAAELSSSASSPSPHFCAHPVSDSNLFDWHFTLAGPPAPSPYAGGIYHGRIVLPPQYPLRPPSFRFLTPSGRFEVNREICLSISGHHEETWQPAWGIRTALTAIRSFMDGDAKGQLGGLDATDEVRRMWAQKSRSWQCEICSRNNEGGVKKSNEDILNEWREVCRQKGVALDAEGRETVPDELRMHYKKEENEEAAAAATTTAGTQQSEEGKNDHVQANSIAPLSSPALESSTDGETTTLLTSQVPQTQQRTPLPSSTSTSTSLSTSNVSTNAKNHPIQSTSQRTPSSLTPMTTTTMSTPPLPSPLPSPLQDQPATTPAASTTQAQTQVPVQPSSRSDPWLDRAIVVVVIALVIMILRRLASVDDI